MGVIIGLYTSPTPPPPSVTVPTVTTTTLSGIKSLGATGGGDVTSDGGATVTVRGICWNTTGTPTTADSKTTDGTGTGVFSSNMRILDPSVTYYVRAYATNSQGTGYGAQQTITTRAFRVLKIDKMETRLANPTQNQEMLDLINTHDYNWIQFYRLRQIFPQYAGTNALTASLATFISKSRAIGVERVGAILGLAQGETNAILGFNNTHPWYQQVDDFNIESEFWLGSNFTIWAASGSYIKSTISSAPYNRGAAYTSSGGNPWVISAYVQNYSGGSGWVQPYVTGSIISNIVDVYEATNYNISAPDATKLIIGGDYPQLNYIASGAFDLGVTRSFVPLYSLEQVAYGAANNFSGFYFNSVGISQGETFWDTAYSGLNFTHKSNLKLVGHNYFDFEWVSASVGV